MRRNAASQTIQAMMRTNSGTDTRIVGMANKSVSGATNATPIVITTSAAHGLIPGMVVTISGVGGNTAANGTFRVIAVGSTTTFSLGDTTDGTNVAGNGAYTSGGTVVCYPVSVLVSKDGGTPTLGTGTLSHVGRMPFGGAMTTDANGTRSTATTTAATVSAVGVTQLTLANGGASSSTLGQWSYTPTAAETNAAVVTFTFCSAVLNAVAVTQIYEPTAGPILLQTTIATYSSQTSFTLTNGHSADDTYNGCLMAIYDSANEAQVAIGVISDYTGSTKTIALLNSPLTASFTFAAGDFVTIIADRSLKPATDTRTAVVDAAGLVDATAVKIGPSGSGTAQTAVDLGGTRAEPGQGTPGATVSFLSKIDYLYKAWRNKKTQTSTTYSLFNDDLTLNAGAGQIDQKATVSDDGTTTTIGEVATGP